MSFTFVDPFAPAITLQHDVIAAHHPGDVRLVIDAAPRDCALPVWLRAKLLGAIHPGVTVLAAAGSFGSSLARASRPIRFEREVEEVRRDPIGNWQQFNALTQAALTVRVCCVGAESTGKTTLVQALAAKHRTHQIHEFGRDYTVTKQREGTNDHWVTEDFVAIAREQQRLEDDAARGAGPLFFCDTDAMSTALWHERYQGHASSAVERIGAQRTYDLFVLCDIDIPWERDGIRLGADTRAAMHQRFLEVLTTHRREPWVLVSGSVEERIAWVETEIERLGLLSASSMYSSARFEGRESVSFRSE